MLVSDNIKLTSKDRLDYVSRHIKVETTALKTYANFFEILSLMIILAVLLVYDVLYVAF